MSGHVVYVNACEEEFIKHRGAEVLVFKFVFHGDEEGDKTV